MLETVAVVELGIEKDETAVNLLTIYDKATTATITGKELKELIKSYYNK